MLPSAGLVSPGVQRLAGACAVIAGVLGFLYSVSFVIVAAGVTPQLGLGPSWVLLLLGALFASFALAVVYTRVRDIEPAVALWSLVLGASGAIGAAVHGAYELALSLNPPAVVPVFVSEIDPRGFLTFGTTAFAFFGISWLMRRGGGFPGGLATLGYLSSVLLVLVYLGRLVIITPTNPLVLVPAGLEGFIVNPVWSSGWGCRCRAPRLDARSGCARVALTAETLPPSMAAPRAGRGERATPTRRPSGLAAALTNGR